MAKEKKEDQPGEVVYRERMTAEPYDADVQKQRQKDAVERHEAQVAEAQQRAAAPLIPTKLSDTGFVGKIKEEPHLEPEIASNKKGTKGFGPGVVHPPEFEVIDQKTHGKVTDKIVVTPQLKETGLPGATPLTEPQKVQQVIDAHVSGDGKTSKKEDKAAADEHAAAEESLAGNIH